MSGPPALAAADSPVGSSPNDGVQRRSGIAAGDGLAFVSHTGEASPSGFLPESGGTIRVTSVHEL